MCNRNALIADLADFIDHANTVQLGHAQIEKRHIWPMFLPKVNGLAAIHRFGDNEHVRLHSNNRSQARQNSCVVICDEYPNLVSG